eukprot:Em0013g145a
MHIAATTFAGDIYRSASRAEAASASRTLLRAVARLLAVVDAVDLCKLQDTTGVLEKKLQDLKGARSEEELMARLKDCAFEISNVIQLAKSRANELKSEASKQLMEAAKTELNRASKLVLSSSRAFQQHRDAQQNCDYVIERLLEAVKVISLLTEGKEADEIERGFGSKAPGELIQRFGAFETLLGSNAKQPLDNRGKENSLKAGLEKILVAAASLGDAETTRDYRQHAIIFQCSELKQKLKELFETMRSSDSVDGAGVDETEFDRLGARAQATAWELKKELRRAMIERVSDAFLDTRSPIQRLVAVAEAADEGALNVQIAEFSKHARELEEVSLFVCSLATNTNNVRVVRISAKHVGSLAPQVICAAQTLSQHPESQAAQKNMADYVEAWFEVVSTLVTTLNSLIPIEDFLAITEADVRRDSQRYVQAIEDRDIGRMNQAVQLISGRSTRLAEVVRMDLRDDAESYSAHHVTQIGRSIERLLEKEQRFCSLSGKAGSSLESGKVNARALEEAAQKVNDCVQDVRRAVLNVRPHSDLEAQPDLEEVLYSPRVLSPGSSFTSQLSLSSSVSRLCPKKFSRTPKYSSVFYDDNTKAIATRFSTKDLVLLAKEAESLTEEKTRLESETVKWENSSNDIVALAKEMCSMVEDITNFTRQQGTGTLQSIMDVVITAKDIIRAGEYLDEQARIIAEQCPDHSCKRDLLSYLERMQLCCHQLKITSDVLKTSAAETVECASSLLSSARNLMKSVVQVVKTCYLASKAIERSGGLLPEQVQQWKLETPKKKRVFPSDSQLNQSTAKEHKRSSLYLSPVHELGEFTGLSAGTKNYTEL